MPARSGRRAGTHRALTIGVGEFAGSYVPLPYATSLAGALRAELDALGYACGDPVPTDWTSQSLGAAVRAAIRSAAADDVLVVHVLTHGEVAGASGKLYVVGSDGTRHDLADVEGWLAAVQDGADPPLVLFVLDICEAGTAARLPWQGATADGSARAWVIAACGPQEQAFNGWLTQATTSVLGRLRAGELDIDPSVEYVPLPKVAQEIRAEVRRLAQTEGDGLSQQVTGTQLDISAVPPDLPFFRNPVFTASTLVSLPPGTETALASFSDGIREPASAAPAPAPAGGPAAWTGGMEPLPQDADLSAEHWTDRVRGHGQILAAPDAGCFTGRLDQLNELVPWMRGWEARDRRTLSVVTGGPGVGKSALLGVLVCAAHPGLREATRPLWSQAKAPPPEIRHLVAVHARQRDLADVTGCLGRQLKAEAGLPDAPSDPAGLVAAVAAAPGEVPVIVLDALDEAIGSQAIVDQLIVPLVVARRPGGTPACRVLVGTRRDGFERLLAAAAAQGGLVDLDDADREQLLADLSGYVGKLLRTQPGYREPAMARARGAFAEEVASALARQPDGDRRWGEFLIAGLYTHSFLRATAAAPVTSGDAAGSRGADCPRTLPEVLELDLKARPNETELRQVLQITALARGAGMPASVIDRCRPRRPRFGPYTPTLRVLSELGFYLRRASDEDGTTLYRVFHEGLADQLRAPADAPEDPAAILLLASLSAWEPAWSRRAAEQAITEAMLGALGSQTPRRWDLAEPYVLRHVLDHALAAFGDDSPGLVELLGDPEFLVHADPSVLAVRPRLESAGARQAVHILTDAESAVSTAAGAGSPSARDSRRAALALAAARAGDHLMAAALAEPPAGSPEAPLPWQPRWTAGRHVHESAMTPFWPDVEDHPVVHALQALVPSALTAGVMNGEQVVVLGTTDGQIQVRSVADGYPVGDPPAGPAYSGELRVPAESGAADLVRAVGVLRGETTVVWSDADGYVRAKDMAVGAGRLIPQADKSSPGVNQSARRLNDAEVVAVEAVTLAGHVLAALTGTDSTVTIVDQDSGQVLHSIPPWPAAVALDADGLRYYAANLTAMTLDGRPAAVTASLDGTIRFWDVPGLREIERLNLPGPVQTVAPVGDYLAVLCCGEIIVYARRKPAGEPRRRETAP